MKTLITGATGFVGRRLLGRLSDCVVLSRSAASAAGSLGPDITAHDWNPTAEPAPDAAFEDVDAVIHLAGDPVAEGRWNPAKKQRILESRELGTRHLVDALEARERRPSVLVSASAVGFYGDRGDELLEESSTPRPDNYLSDVCIRWEQEARRAEELGIRVVCIRVGIVLGKGGGALAKMLTPFKLGVGGRLGDGSQWMPWIHLDDLVSMFLFAAENPNVHGTLNGVAPNAVTNLDFTKSLGKALRRPTLFPAPAFALKLALGEFANVLLASQRVVPRAALDAGFEFQHPDLDGALADLV